MPSGVPQTIGQQLFRKLEDLLISRDTPDEMTLRRLERDAENLMKVDAADAYIVLAGIAAVRWDLDRVLSYSRNAIKLDPRSLPTLVNAALNMHNANFMNEAAEQVVSALGYVHADGETWSRAVNYLVYAGQFHRAAEILRDGMNRGLAFPDDTEEAIEYADLVDRHQIDPEQLKFEFSVVASVLQANHKRVRAFAFSEYVDPEGGACLVATIGVDGTVADEIRLDAEIAPRFAESAGWNPNKLSIEILAKPYHAGKSN